MCLHITYIIRFCIVFTTPLIISSATALIFFAAFMYLLLNGSIKNSAISKPDDINYNEEILRTTIEIQEQTFINIRQQIHDNIGQTLSLAKLNMNTSTENISAEKMVLTEELLGKAITELRDISKNLYSENTAMRDLVKGIQSEVNIISQITSLHTKFIAPLCAPVLSEEQTIILIRSAQVLLHNIVRYAKAGKITAELTLSADNLIISINDNGKAIYYELCETKTAVQSLRQRLQLIKAKLCFETKKENGNFAKIELSVPENSNYD